MSIFTIFLYRVIDLLAVRGRGLSRRRGIDSHSPGAGCDFAGIALCARRQNRVGKDRALCCYLSAPYGADTSAAGVAALDADNFSPRRRITHQL